MSGRVEDAMLKPEVTEPFVERPAVLLERRALGPILLAPDQQVEDEAEVDPDGGD